MGYQGCDEILMDSLISSKNLWGIKLWDTLNLKQIKVKIIKVITVLGWLSKNNSIDSSLLGEEVKCPTMNQDLYGNDISGLKKWLALGRNVVSYSFKKQQALLL